jgi:hypothetical protein
VAHSFSSKFYLGDGWFGSRNNVNQSTSSLTCGGDRVSVWLNSDTGGGESGEVVRQIGTNAIPTLLRLLRTKDSALKVKLMDWQLRQHIIKIKYTPAETWHFRAAYAFGVLGTNAQTAVPALIKIADDSISLNSRVCAIESLGYVGLSSKEADYALSRLATNADSRVRSWAKSGLLRINEAAIMTDITNSP